MRTALALAKYYLINRTIKGLAASQMELKKELVERFGKNRIFTSRYEAIITETEAYTRPACVVPAGWRVEVRKRVGD